MRLSKIHGIGVAFVCLMVGCSADRAEDSDTDQDDVVVGTSDFSNDVAVFSDRLEFDASVAPKLEKAGVLQRIDARTEAVYLVGDRQSDALTSDESVRDGVRNPVGYLRKALSWQKNDRGVIIIKTEPATIAEALEEIKRNGFLDGAKGTLRPRAGNGEDVDHSFGSTDQTFTHTFGPAEGFTPFDFSGKELWSKKLLAGGEARVVLSKGKVTLKPTLETRIVIKHFIPQMARAVVDTSVDGDLEITASTDGAFEVFEGDTLLKKSFGTTVNGMPLTLGLEVRWECGLGATGRSVGVLGVSAHGRLRAGAEWSGSIKGVLDKPTYSFSPFGPRVDSSVNVAGTCHLVPELTLQLFDSSGPQATLDLYANLNADASQVQLGAKANALLTAGVEAKVGGSLRPFGIKIADINAGPFKFEQEVFKGEITIGKQ